MLFLDYDGTLTPIVETPNQAIIPSETKDLLEQLSRKPKCKLAIISGRALKDIKNIVGIKNIIYAGNHGLEIEGPKIKFAIPVSPDYRAILKKIKKSLNIKISSISGAFIEDKGLSLSLHYRLTDKKDIPLLKGIFSKVVSPYLGRNKSQEPQPNLVSWDNIRIKSGKMVLEIGPAVKWDKGKVVLWLSAKQKAVLNRKSIIPIYIGDDRTDEDAFKAIKNKGLSIFVGKPKHSQSNYYLKNTREVVEFLKQILKQTGG